MRFLELIHSNYIIDSSAATILTTLATPEGILLYLAFFGSPPFFLEIDLN